MRKLILTLIMSLLAVFVTAGIHPAVSYAGFLDKLNQATQKINQASQQIEQTNQLKNKLPKMKSGTAPSTTSDTTSGTEFSKTPTTNPITGEWGSQDTGCGANSATCMNGMDNLMNCMNQSKGYYYRLAAAKLEDGLNNTPDLSDQDRRDLQADITAVKNAVTTNQVADPDPQNPQRWLAWLTDEDQAEINKLNSKYMKEVHDDCDARFGGMSQFSH